MINLLLPESKVALRREFRRRVAVVAGVLILSLAISGLILEAAFYFVLWPKRRALEASLAQGALATEPARFDEVEKALATTAREVAVVLLPHEAPPLSRLLAELAAKRREATGVSLGEMTFDLTASPATLNLRGVATTRQNFLDFIKILSASDLIETVDYPVSNLINERNVRFVLAVTLS